MAGREIIETRKIRVSPGDFLISTGSQAAHRANDRKGRSRRINATHAGCFMGSHPGSQRNSVREAKLSFLQLRRYVIALFTAFADLGYEPILCNDMIVIDSVRLAAALIDAGLGQFEICIKAGVGHQTLAKMLKGEMVRVSSVSRICKVLDVPAAQIIREVADENIQTQG
jgi:DNA-binding Xre family transcriptional regulator